jgi:hypothetical protein
VVASLATAIVAVVAVLLAQPYFTAPTELAPPQRPAPTARVTLPVRAELAAPAPAPLRAGPTARAVTRATASRHKRPHPHAAAHGARWDADAALPPP